MTSRSDECHFLQRVDDFWAWFPTVAQEAYQDMNEGDLDGIMSRFPSEMNRLMPNLSWVFGPGKDDGLSLTITGEGQKGKQMLAACWLNRAVELPNWSFYASRQASPRTSNEGAEIDVGGNRLGLIDVRATPIVDVESQCVDLQVWHPLFEKLDEDGRWQILYLFLDEVLGEFGTQTWLGNLEFEPGEHNLSLIDLPPYLNRLQDQHEWEKHSPLEEYTGYQTNEPVVGYPRSDVIAGYTLYPHLIFQYGQQGEPVEEDPIEGTGAEFVFVTIDNKYLPEDDPTVGREEIERIVVESLGESAWLIGGATGIESSYLDFLLLRGDESKQKIQQALQSLNVDLGSEILSFCK